uniref:Predicted protein n=1 Tax=Physcomitrium patens TaxID=3218 RepID=A9U827_PHYPA
MKDGRIEAEGSLAELLESSTEMQLLWQGELTDSSEAGEQTDSKNETVKKLIRPPVAGHHEEREQLDAVFVVPFARASSRIRPHGIQPGLVRRGSHGADAERGEKGAAVIRTDDASVQLVSVLDGARVAVHLAFDPAVHLVQLIQGPVVAGHQVIGRNPPRRTAGIIGVGAVGRIFQEVGRRRLVRASRVDDKVGQQSRRCTVICINRIDNGVGFINDLGPPGITGSLLERLQMVQHEV